MATPQEVEIKFLVSDLKGARARSCVSWAFMRRPHLRTRSTLFTICPARSCAARASCCGCAITEDKWRLTHKAKVKLGKHKSRGELETGVSDGKQMDAILHALGYSPSFVYEKFRAEWSDDEGHVVLDHTPIGDVAEIEGKSRWIDRIARELGVKPADYITKSYAELFFDWKRRTGSKAENMTFREVGEKQRLGARVSVLVSVSSFEREGTNDAP